jgi:hypothetical protein
MCQDCARLYDELQKQEGISYGLRKRITSLKGELRWERQEKARLIKEARKGEKQHYRNGQKRGRTRNG